MADQGVVGKETQIHQTVLLKEIYVEFNPEACTHIMETETNEISVVFDERCGSNWRSKAEYRYGAFGTKIKCPTGETTGLNFNFRIASPMHYRPIHSIGFNFLGNAKRSIRTNAYVTATDNSREQVHELDFDCSEGFHDYEIKWSKDLIEWLVDGEVIRRYAREENTNKFPKKVMSLRGMVWNASRVQAGKWAGYYTGNDAPYVYTMKDVRVPLLTEVPDSSDDSEEEWMAYKLLED
ncbi:hypothetical protein MKX01_033772 [Papaver californicum]|nr:hypothetical protein MKX01_033772 [Papaver californicum]